MVLSEVPRWVFAASAMGFGGIAASLGSWRWLSSRGQIQRRRSAGDQDAPWDQVVVPTQSDGAAAAVIRYLTSLDRRLSLGSAHRLTGATAAKPKSSEKDADLLACAGLAGLLRAESLREGSARLALAGTFLLGAVGWVLSAPMAVVLGLVGLAGGAMAPRWALRQERKARSDALGKELPELLEVMGLGLRSGLTFDRSFSLYHEHFDTPFARSCAITQRQWTLGLKPRAQALRDLAKGYDSPLFARVVDSVIRSLRFGTSLAESLDSAAAEARADYKAKKEEQVAKAPVKMMIPTGTLILPAMLLMVLGPVLLELMEGF